MQGWELPANPDRTEESRNWVTGGPLDSSSLKLMWQKSEFILANSSIHVLKAI